MTAKNLDFFGSERFVAGVDFSGAKGNPNETWLAIGNLGSLGVQIVDLQRVGSHKLTAQIAASPPLLAIGLDFPFSIPVDFAQFFAKQRHMPPFQSWQELAMALAFVSFEEFTALIASFEKESKRFTDKECKPVAQSPLHRGNPSMVQMTFQGMRLLAGLDPKKFSIAPFQDADPAKCQLLEIYPSATLNDFRLQFRGYKSKEKKDRESMMAARKTIIRQLENLRETGDIALKDIPRLSMNPQIESSAITSDDAFDAIVACYTAAIFVIAPKHFTDPYENDNLDVLIEGWIYHPNKIWVPDKVRA